MGASCISWIRLVATENGQRATLPSSNERILCVFSKFRNFPCFQVIHQGDGLPACYEYHSSANRERCRLDSIACCCRVPSLRSHCTVGIACRVALEGAAVPTDYFTPHTRTCIPGIPVANLQNTIAHISVEGTNRGWRVLVEASLSCIHSAAGGSCSSTMYQQCSSSNAAAAMQQRQSLPPSYLIDAAAVRYVSAEDAT